MRPLFVLILVNCILASLTGCGDERKPVNPGTGMIPLYVWSVLAAGDGTGQINNHGNRLSNQEMTDHITQLHNNALVLYGFNVDFQWSGNVNVIQDPGLLPTQPRTRDVISWKQSVLVSNWQSGHINIYFVGNVQINVNDPKKDLALTADPKAIPSNPYILLNDGGFDSSFFFEPLFEPAQVVSYHVLEHEMTHFLGRFENKSFGPQGATYSYDAAEHPLGGPKSILTPPAPPVLLLFLPGTINDPDLVTERGQIADRIINGQWPNQ